MRLANRSADLPSGETHTKRSGFRKLKTDRELGVERVTEIARPIFFVLKAILNLQLRVRRETIASRDIRAPHVVPPRSASSVSIWHVAEKLLVPANGAEKLRRKFILPL